MTIAGDPPEATVARARSALPVRSRPTRCEAIVATSGSRGCCASTGQAGLAPGLTRGCPRRAGARSGTAWGFPLRCMLIR